MKTGLTMGMVFLAALQAGRAADTLKAFPPATAGRVRFVLELPKQADESAFQVELIVGRTVPVDGQNRYFFSGRIETEVIQGWGCTCYVVTSLGAMAGTLVAVDPAAPKVPRFISLGGDPCLVPYNSRLPIVLYLPEGAEARYRIWTAGTETPPLGPG